MSIALMHVLPIDVIDRIFDMRPLDQITITIIHDQHFCLNPDEYTYKVPIGVTVGEIKEMFLKDSFEAKGWNYDELWLWWNINPFVELWDSDDFEEDTTLTLNLMQKIEPSDGEDEDPEYDF